MTQTILLADDSVTIQKVIELTFMDEDYEVVSAGNGDEALDRLEEVAPDVVIADVHMPGASGFDVAKRAKQLHPAAPVLLLVGTFEPFDEADFEASGADSYLKKPFDSQELLQRVNDLLAAAADGAGQEELGTATEPLTIPDAPPPPPASTPAAAEEEDLEDLEDLGTRAIPEFGGDREEAVRPAVPPEPARAQPSDAGAADAEPAGGVDEEPFPELAAPSAAGPAPTADDDDIFRGFAEADGSSEVRPPLDLESKGEGEGEPAEPEFELHEEPGWDLDLEPAPEPDEEPEPAQEPDFRFETEPEAGDATDAGEPVPEPAVVDTTSESAAAESAVSGVSTPVAAAPPAGAGRDTDTVPPAGAALSDADVDRIARRVVELLGGDALREVAWDVVPDLAEVVIKERLRELEEQAEPS